MGTTKVGQTRVVMQQRIGQLKIQEPKRSPIEYGQVHPHPRIMMATHLQLLPT